MTFEVPNTIDTGSRSILGFMLDVDNLDDPTLTLRMNGTKVWTSNYFGASSHPVRYFQEVIAAGVVKPGSNVFSFDSFIRVIFGWWRSRTSSCGGRQTSDGERNTARRLSGA